MKRSITLVLFCLLSNITMAQVPLYKGQIILEKESLDSLKKDLVRNIATKINEISRDEFLFFKLEVSRKGIANITELYKVHNECSSKVQAAIQASSNFWGSKRRKNITLVIPIFLIIDKEQGKFPKDFYTTFTSNNIDDSIGIINCLLIPPIIINLFKQN